VVTPQLKAALVQPDANTSTHSVGVRSTSRKAPGRHNASNALTSR
jgi:hypothetical protein